MVSINSPSAKNSVDMVRWPGRSFSQSVIDEKRVAILKYFQSSTCFRRSVGPEYIIAMPRKNKNHIDEISRIRKEDPIRGKEKRFHS
jgi:hypothetical protein